MSRAAALLALALLSSCSGCQRGGVADAGARTPGDDGPALWSPRDPVSTGPLADGGTITVRLPLEPAGLTRIHDRFAEGTTVRLTVGPLYETLARIDWSTPDGALVPWLATAWAESADHLTLTVTLREGVRFHDGSPLTSADVKATLDAVLEPTHATAAFRASFELVAKVEAPDARTLVVTWRAPYFLSARTLLAALPVMPAHALQGDFDALPVHRAPIGTGPFRFSAWEPGTAITLVRHDDYWGRRAHLDRLVFRFVKDDVAAAQAWEKGELDLVTRLSPQAFQGAQAPGRRAQFAAWRLVAFPENAYAWLGFNQRQPRFRDARVRRALGLLYPGQLVATMVDLGLEPRTACPWHPASASCDPSITPLPLDPGEAKRLLDEAGWKDTDGDGVRDDGKGTALSFAFLAAAQSLKMRQVLPLYQDSLRQAGVAARIETVDASAYLSRVRAHDFDAMALSWSTPDVEQDQFQNFHSSQADAGTNYLGYQSPEADALLEQIRVEFEPARRHALERALHRRLTDDQVYLFMSRRPALDAHRRALGGLAPTLGGYDFAAAGWKAR